MTRILYIITKSVWGGAQRYVFDLATNLPQESYEIAVALGGNGILKDRLIAKNIAVIPIENLNRDVNFTKDIRSFFEIIKICKTSKPDIIHLNSSKIGLLGAIAGRLTGVPRIIFTAHGWAFNEDRPLVIKWIIKFLSWLTCLFATDIVVLSEREKNQTNYFPFVKNKIKKIYLGINDYPLLSRDTAREIIAKKISSSSDFLKDKTIIGSIGELHRNKGYEYAIRAISSLRACLSGRQGPAKQSLHNFVFIIIGSGEKESRLRGLIKELNLENHVFLAGFIENASTLLPAFDVFILPSLKEGLPYVILEAGLTQLPIVATNVGGIPEIIPSNRSGITIEPKDTEGIALALKLLLGDANIRASLGKNIHKNILEKFNLQTMLQNTLEIYQR